MRLEHHFNLNTQQIYDLLSKWKGCTIYSIDGNMAIYDLDASVPIPAFREDILPYVTIFVK